MGLDTYASRSPGDVELTGEDEQAFEQAAIGLCGGMMSGDGGSSFRGKVYLDVVDRVAGASLGAEWTLPKRCARSPRPSSIAIPPAWPRIRRAIFTRSSRPRSSRSAGSSASAPSAASA